MDKLDLGWGDPYFLLEILGKMYTPPMGSSLAPQNCTYAENAGDPELLLHVKAITEHTTGNEYKHYYITNGATQAINTILRCWKGTYDYKNAVTSHLGYPYYPHMISKSGLNYVTVDLKTYEADHKDIMVIDSPSNPLGEQLSRNFETRTIWDAVYHNSIYNACPAIKPSHNVYVGSFSKFLGLTGSRVGWIATNDIQDFNSFKHDSLMENATVSVPSQKYVKNILQSIDLMQFMKFGKNSLDQNRHELQKLKKITGTDVQEKGMFYCFEADDKLHDLFINAGIQYVVFPYGDRSLIRLNIGQTNAILKKAVKAVQKTDKVK